MKQLALFEEPPAPLEMPSLATPSYRGGLIEQIKRDMAVVKEDPVCHVPSLEFYLERIAACRAEILRYDSEHRQ